MVHYGNLTKGDDMIKLQTLTNIGDYLDDWRLSFPRFVSYDELDNFKEQSCSLTEFNHEYVKQLGDCDYGFSGTIGFPIDNNTVMLIDWCE